MKLMENVMPVSYTHLDVYKRQDYIRPQENGSHYDCEYVELNNSRYGIVASAEKAFSFNASYYTQEELEKKTHNYELTESDSVVFCVDYALNGIGSNLSLIHI